MLCEIHKVLPGAAIHYVADSAWCPYGPRPAAEIRSRCETLVDQLIGLGCAVIVIACNSATISAIEHLRATYPLPFVGMEPAVKPAAVLSKSGVIGIMATEASLAGEKFHRLVDQHASSLRVITLPCPDFVSLVERGDLNSPAAREAAHRYTKDLVDKGADVLVLGCSHYPFLRPLIEEAAGPGVIVVDTGSPIARRLVRIVSEEGLQLSPGPITLHSSSSPPPSRDLIKTLCPGLELEIADQAW